MNIAGEQLEVHRQGFDSLVDIPISSIHAPYYVAVTYLKVFICRIFLRIRGRYVRFATASYRLTEMTTLSEHLSRLGTKGGKARAKNMTPEARSDSARKAVEARWAKQKAELKKLASEITQGSKALLKKAQRRQAELAKKKG